MRLNHAAFFALLIALGPSGVEALATAQQNLGTYEDRTAVEDVMARYVWAVDSLDADGYVAVFTEDAHALGQGWQDDCGCDGPLRRPAREAQWQVVDSVAQADCLHRLSACPQTGGHGAPTNASQGDIS